MSAGMQIHAPDTVDHWHEAIDLAGLHVCRSVEDLDREMVCKLVRLLPGVDMSLCLAGERAGSFRAQIVIGGGVPFERGTEVDPDGWQIPAGRRYPLRYRNHELGALLVATRPEPAAEQLLTAMMAHYGVGLVNLTLGEESRQATEHYCASLQALEEGIVLFQESDRGAITARLIGLGTSMVHATAGALYELSEVGDVTSDLTLTQTLGIPDQLLRGFTGTDGVDWPRSLIHGPAFAAWRSEDPTLGGLDPQQLPQILQNLMAIPLRYHGVVAGVCILFNVGVTPEQTRDHLERLNSLGQLGAALLHRLSLEAASVRNRDIETQLAIAATVQRRLLPRRAPDVAGLDFAWRSVAAQSIGGDYLDVLAAGDRGACALIADAAGHGINSALLMSSFRSAYRAGAPASEPADLLASLNAEVFEEVGNTGMFITAVALKLAPDSRRLIAASAGHNPVLHLQRASRTVERIESHGPPLGFLPTAEYASEQRELAPGDILLLYTDGITEACNGQGEMFGEERLTECLHAAAELSAEAVLERVLARLTAFTGRSGQDDDVSILVIRAEG